MNLKDLCVVIPARNEEKSVSTVLRSILEMWQVILGYA